MKTDFEEWAKNQDPAFIRDVFSAAAAFQAAQQSERERIKGRVKTAAESLWCIRNQVGDEPYDLYIGPSLNTLEQFVEKLMETE